jgi:hypothetical protein
VLLERQRDRFAFVDNVTSCVGTRSSKVRAPGRTKRTASRHDFDASRFSKHTSGHLSSTFAVCFCSLLKNSVSHQNLCGHSPSALQIQFQIWTALIALLLLESPQLRARPSEFLGCR